jgi:hypothetical protein
VLTALKNGGVLSLAQIEQVGWFEHGI